MDDEIRQKMLSNPSFRILRWTAPWVALGLVLLALGGLAGEFRKAAAERAALETSTVDTTASVSATATTSTAGPQKPETAEQPVSDAVAKPQSTVSPTSVAIALVEGILLRKDPSPSGEVMDRLRNGTEMMVLETTDSWLKVKDPLGRVGWIRNNENLVSVKQKQ